MPRLAELDVAAGPARAAVTGAPWPPYLRSPVDLELVIPAYNEAGRLPATLSAMAGFLSTRPWRSRLVVVDNGSTDDTAGVVVGTGPDAVDVVVVGCARPGKGAAVRRGIAGSTSRFVGFVDDGRQYDSPTTCMMSGAWPPPAPSAW